MSVMYLISVKDCVVDVYCVYTEAARIIYEICLALEFLHTNDIAHRDLKVMCICCANVMMDTLFTNSF